MRVYMTREFARLAARMRVSESSLCEAVHRAERGLVNASIGRLLIKQRVARKNEGRSGGFRAVIFHQVSERAVLLHVFAKNDQGTLTPHEESTYREFAKVLATVTSEQCMSLVRDEKWIEIDYEEYQQKVSK